MRKNLAKLLESGSILICYDLYGVKLVQFYCRPNESFCHSPRDNHLSVFRILMSAVWSRKSCQAKEKKTHDDDDLNSSS